MTALTKTEIISRKIEFEGWNSLETVVVRPPSMKHAGNLPPMSREVLYCGQAVVALLYLPKTDQVLLNQQFRIGAFVIGDEQPCLYECCAGMIDEGEAAEDAVRREALEETGCQALDMEFIGKVYPSPGNSTEVYFLYCARIEKAEEGYYGLEEEGEEIKTHLVSVDKALLMLEQGLIPNAATALCLLWLARHRQRLQKKWG